MTDPDSMTDNMTAVDGGDATPTIGEALDASEADTTSTQGESPQDDGAMAKPMPGYATLSISEVRYCLAEDMRIAAQKTELDSLSSMVGASFSALPRIASQVAEDAKALEKLAAEAAQEEADLFYAADIGTFSKSRLAIDKTGVEWRGKRTSLPDVCGVRWGAVKKSVNGIPTGTDYLIAWTDGYSETSAEFKNGAIFEAFVPKLWKAVGFRLIDEMVRTLAGGGELRFGSMIARDDTVVLTRRKFLGSEPAEFGWGDVSVTTADGSFVVNGPKGSKASASMAYREVTNIHFFEALVRQAFKNGRVRLQEVDVDDEVLVKLLLFERCGDKEAYAELLRAVNESDDGYEHATKGEMLKRCADQPLLRQLVDASTSCGRFSRTGFRHCGRCVPCQVRRASYLEWGHPDGTNKGYVYAPLGQNDRKHARFDDVRSVAMAIEAVRRDGVDALIGGVMNSRLLGDVAPYRDVVARGIAELAALHTSLGVR